MEILKDIQKEIYNNKVNRGFNITNIEFEFCRAYGELSEAFEAYKNKMPTVGEELADVAIFLYGIAEILDYDLNQEILKKVERNKSRVYGKIAADKIHESEE